MGMFEVDPKGLRKLLAGRDYGFIINELAQNAFDEEGVTTVAIEVRPVEGKRQVQVLVSDDSPEGFRRLSDAWTLFAESYKKGNPLQRGRFDLGEKLVISLCKRAEITTTKGAVRFENDKRSTLRRKRDRGTLVSLWVPATNAQIAEMIIGAERLIPPPGIKVTLNGEVVTTSAPIKTFTATLPTINVDENAQLRRSNRIASVDVHEANGSGAWLYEMGIPVVPIKATWTLDVQQKVPLNMDRDNVSPAFLRKLFAHTLNAMADQLPKADAASDWVVTGTSAPEIKPEAFSAVMDRSIGEKRTIFDPSDREANQKAMSEGFTVVKGNQLSEGQRENIRRFRDAGHDPVRPSGRVFPTAKPYSDNPDAPPVEVVPQSKWTSRQKNVVRLAKHVFDEIVGAEVGTRTGKLDVRIVNTTNAFSAAYGSGTLDLNVMRLGHAFFDTTDRDGLVRVLDLLIHEFGHHYCGNHLDGAYYRALTALGARLAVSVPLRKYRTYGYTV